MAESFSDSVKSASDSFGLAATQPELIQNLAKNGGFFDKIKSDMVAGAAQNPNYNAEMQTGLVESLPAIAKVSGELGSKIPQRDVSDAADYVAGKADAALRSRTEEIMQGFGNTSPSDPYIAARQEGDLRGQAKEVGAISDRLATALCAAKNLDWKDSAPSGGQAVCSAEKQSLPSATTEVSSSLIRE